jgi:hypothetical protein
MVWPYDSSDNSVGNTAGLPCITRLGKIATDLVAESQRALWGIGVGMMESQRLRELGKTLATKISRRRALAAAASGVGGSAPDSFFNRGMLAAASAAVDPATEAGHRLTAAVEHDHIPLPTVRLPVETDGGGLGQ